MNFAFFDLGTLFSNFPSASNPFVAMLYLFLNGGWIVFILIIIWGLWEAYKEYITNRFDEAIEYVLLAIDIPKDNELSPKAVEHIFSHISGIRKTGNLKDKYLKGYTQMGVSLEIVSIEGYIQFLIRTPVKFRDLVEAAVYAQYPDAEITEVEDYIDMIPKPLELENSDYDIWGTEYKLKRPDYYPLKTYPFFEHSLSQAFMDPMASLLEIMSRLGPGEHLWIQILIQPVKDYWRKEGIKLINKLIGKKNPSKNGLGDLTYFPREISKGIAESFTASLIPPSEMSSEAKKQGEREWPSMIMHLSPDEKEIIEAIGMKMSKVGFKSKIRFIYAAPRDRMNRGKGVYAINGAFAQFSTQNLNSLALNKKTHTKIDYFFIKSRLKGRKKRILWAYRNRSMKRGRRGYILNTEELATLWHFPVLEVKAPTVQKVDAKKGQPPSDLPFEFSTQSIAKPSMGKKAEKKSAAPDNLPTN